MLDVFVLYCRKKLLDLKWIEIDACETSQSQIFYANTKNFGILITTECVVHGHMKIKEEFYGH